MFIEFDWSPQGDEIGLRGRDREANGSSEPTGASHGPFSAVRRPVGSGCLHGRRTERTSGSSGSGAWFGTDATPTAMPESMSLTRTEAAHLTSSRAMRTTEYGFAWSPDGAVDSLRQGEPRGHLRDRCRRTRNNHRLSARFADSLRVSSSGVGAGRAIGRLTTTDPRSATASIYLIGADGHSSTSHVSREQTPSPPGNLNSRSPLSEYCGSATSLGLIRFGRAPGLSQPGTVRGPNTECSSVACASVR